MQADLQALTSRANTYLARHLCKPNDLFKHPQDPPVARHCGLKWKHHYKGLRVSWLCPRVFEWGVFERCATTACDLYQCVAQHQMKQKIVQALQIKGVWHWWKIKKEKHAKNLCKAQPFAPPPLSSFLECCYLLWANGLQLHNCAATIGSDLLSNTCTHKHTKCNEHCWKKLDRTISRTTWLFNLTDLVLLYSAITHTFSRGLMKLQHEEVFHKEHIFWAPNIVKLYYVSCLNFVCILHQSNL